jgi:hypothetical protein
MVNDWNSWFEWFSSHILYSFQGRLFQFRIVHGKKDCYLSCKRVGGIWYERGCMVLGFLRRNINISSTKVKEQAYNSIVRPSLKYACSVWDPIMIAVWVVCVWMVFDECMFLENLTDGMSISVFGIATSSCVILYSMTRRASVLRSARVLSIFLFSFPNIYIIMWSCPGNMPKYYTGPTRRVICLSDLGNILAY